MYQKRGDEPISITETWRTTFFDNETKAGLHICTAGKAVLACHHTSHLAFQFVDPPLLLDDQLMQSSHSFFEPQLFLVLLLEAAVNLRETL